MMTAAFPNKPSAAATFAILLLFVTAAPSWAVGPFARLAGHWQGGGQINLSEGDSEPIKCRAAYDVLDSASTDLQLNIRCAGQSYSFDLRGSAEADGNRISGTWSEATRNAAGTLSGIGRGDRFQVTANGSSFSVSLTLITRGMSQSITIRSADPQSEFKGASIELQHD